MSSWKLVEAEAEPNEVQQQVEENKPRADAQRTYTRSSAPRTGRGGGRGSPTGRGRGSSTYRTKSERSYYSYLAVQQIDLIFNPDSLCMDTYIRTYMDEEGYVPVSLVCTYQNVSCYGCSYYDILNKLKEVAIKSKYYEMDTENDLLRLKDDWKKFLFPNPFGGFGVPKYVKQTIDGQTGYFPAGYTGCGAVEEGSYCDQTGIEGEVETAEGAYTEAESIEAGVEINTAVGESVVEVKA